MVTAHLEQEWIDAVEASWRTNPGLSGGGQLSDSGSHLLDALLWITDTEPAAVAATVDNRGADVDVNAALSVELTSKPGNSSDPPVSSRRITASIGVSGAGTSSPAPGERLEVFGTEGRVAFDGERLTVVSDDEKWTAAPEPPAFDELTRRKLADFVTAAREGRTPRSSGVDALDTVGLTEAAYESASAGERVSVPAIPARQ